VALSPTNRAAFSFGQSVTLNAAPGGGTGPYTVTFYTNGDSVATLSSAPFSTNLGILPVGSYTGYVQVADSLTTISYSTTNVFTILTNVLTANLTSPSNGQFVLAGQALTLTATAAVGVPLTVSSVEFFLDGVSVGLDNITPFSVSAGSLSAGVHTVF